MRACEKLLKAGGLEETFNMSWNRVLVVVEKSTVKYATPEEIRQTPRKS
jgi:hypothetical protein